MEFTSNDFDMNLVETYMSVISPPPRPMVSCSFLQLCLSAG